MLHMQLPIRHYTYVDNYIYACKTAAYLDMCMHLYVNTYVTFITYKIS